MDCTDITTEGAYILKVIEKLFGQNRIGSYFRALTSLRNLFVLKSEGNDFSDTFLPTQKKERSPQRVRDHVLVCKIV